MSKKKSKKIQKERRNDFEQKFSLAHRGHLSKEEKAVLQGVNSMKEASYYELCSIFDWTPDELEECLLSLKDRGFLTLDMEKRVAQLTEGAVRRLAEDKKTKKQEKKFLQFLFSLSEEELSDFMNLVDSSSLDPKDIVRAVAQNGLGGLEPAPKAEAPAEEKEAEAAPVPEEPAEEKAAEQTESV